MKKTERLLPLSPSCPYQQEWVEYSDDTILTKADFVNIYGIFIFSSELNLKLQRTLSMGFQCMTGLIA